MNMIKLIVVTCLLLLDACQDGGQPSQGSGAAVETDIATGASYELKFVSTWSAATHPENFPTGPHFSGLIGATHNSEAVFWAPGALATTGIKNMAELGSKTALQSEVDAAMAVGKANAVLSGGGIGVSPGEVTITFTANKNFSLLTLVSMLAPSPDWFVGVSGFSLIENGNWITQKDIDLAVYDSGTDSGVSFSSANAVTNPPEVIKTLTAEQTDFNDGLPIIGHFSIKKLN